MSDERCCSGSGGILLAFLAGGLVGAGLALLYTPVTGREARERIGGLAGDLKKKTEEWKNIYPTFGKIAEEEGFAAPAAIFRRVAEVEVEHEKRYLRLLGHVKNGTLYKREKPIRWKCAKCGRVHEGTEAPERCPTCAHPQGWFIPVEANY